MRSDIEFYSEGVKLAGVLFTPEGLKPGERRGGIAVAHGLSGAKNVRLLPVAEELARAGYVALAIDCRGFGKSGGERGRLIPLEQVTDLRNALTYLAMRPDVDGERLGLYGTSLGGGIVAQTAAVDPRVKCTVASAGIGDGERWLRHLWGERWPEFLRRLDGDRKGRVRTGKSEYVHVFDFAPYPEGDRKDRAQVQAQEPFIDRFPLETADALCDFKPERVVGYIAPRAILYIHGAEDTLVPPEESRQMHAGSREPKKLMLLPGANHYDIYQFQNPACYAEVMSIALGWYAAHLPTR